MPDIVVNLIACVAGNPLKAWHGTTGPDDAKHVPDDVWEDKSFAFGEDLDAAKNYVKTLHPDMTTHVVIVADGRVIWEQDRGEDLDAAHLLTDDEHQAREDAIAGVVVVPDGGVGPVPADPPPAPPAFSAPKGA